MAKSKQETLEESVHSAMKAAEALGEGTVQRITVDGTATGEYPYQIVFSDADFPVVGLATSSGVLSNVAGATNPAKRDPGERQAR